MTGATLEGRISALASRQLGVVTREQLQKVGMSSSAVGRRLKSGRLRQLHRGVYLVGPVEPDRASEMGAVLAGGPAAVLSHTSALRLWEMSRIDPPRPVHVTVPGSGRRWRPGIAFHRVEALADDEHGNLDGIPVTTPARTIADIAGMLASREVEQALAVGEREGLLTSRELARLTERYPRRQGMPLLRAILRGRRECHFTRSEAERRCLHLIRTAELPRPHTNVTVGPYELDLLWPEAGVAVEIDGWKHHSARARFEADRRKDNWLRARGIEVIRVSWRQITRRGTATAVQVGQTLALARARRRMYPAPDNEQASAPDSRGNPARAALEPGEQASPG